MSMVPPSAARDGEVAWGQGDVSGGRVRGSGGNRGSVGRGQELLELDELAASFLLEDEDDELESLFDDEDSDDLDSDDFDSELDESLPFDFAFEERLSVL